MSMPPLVAEKKRAVSIYWFMNSISRSLQTEVCNDVIQERQLNNIFEINIIVFVRSFAEYASMISQTLLVR